MGWIANAATRKETSNVGSCPAIRDGSGWLVICCVGLLLAVMASATVGAEPAERAGGLFASDNLVAWCIVPFDARKRSPAERAEMVRRLGLRRVAYDWRQEHVPLFEEEILQYRKQGIEFFAFWDWHDAIEPLIRKHGIRPQIWRTSRSPDGGSETERVDAAARAQLDVVNKARDLGLKFGLYNHGGWGGEPQNLIKVCQHLRQHYDASHVGIVYNFHHGHDAVKNFAADIRAMEPYLLCVNINGMADERSMKTDPQGNKILPVGSGTNEAAMLKALLESDYDGPIGILDHEPAVDAEISLVKNLQGLKKLQKTLD